MEPRKLIEREFTSFIRGGTGTRKVIPRDIVWRDPTPLEITHIAKYSGYIETFIVGVSTKNSRRYIGTPVGESLYLREICQICPRAHVHNGYCRPHYLIFKEEN